MEELNNILYGTDLRAKKALFLFDVKESNEAIEFKFQLWARYLLPEYFESDDAMFHREMNIRMIQCYKGEIDSFVNAAFRGAGKDVKTKLFIAYIVLNDMSQSQKFIRILAEDAKNSKQTVTDIYNILVRPRVAELYPTTFEKTDYKREETMLSFTTSYGVKVSAGTVGTEQRGAIQEQMRPALIIFNDFESRNTLRSAITTRTIWDNMEEARTGLQKGGACMYLCNYISEMGNVHRLIVDKLSDRKVVMITPIEKDGVPTWDRYTKEDIDYMRKTDDDFEGERMCRPNASKDIYFDRAQLDIMKPIEPIKVVGGFKIFKPYDPSHRYAGGHDIAGGVGLDSSTSVFIDFDCYPAQVVGTYHSNTILPEAFGDEIYNESLHFGTCLVAPENNKFDQAVLKAKQLGADIYKMIKREISLSNGGNPVTYGWTTNALTKSKMYADLKSALDNGLLNLNDIDLINEAKSLTRNDVIDKEEDPRLVTRHRDLLTALAICWQMRNHVKTKMPKIEVRKLQAQQFDTNRYNGDLNSTM